MTVAMLVAIMVTMIVAIIMAMVVAMVVTTVVAMVVTMVAAMVVAITGVEEEGAIIETRQQAVDSRYRYWNFSATAHRICRTTRGDRDSNWCWPK
jgi:hypothetical protein